MWIINLDGMFSAVQHRDKPDTLIIRSRSRDDLHNLSGRIASGMPMREIEAWFPAGMPEIVGLPDADYPFRVEMPAAAFAWYAAAVAVAIDYPNFKNAVAATSGRERARTYHDVWDALLPIEDEAESGVEYASRRNPYADKARYMGAKRLGAARRAAVTRGRIDKPMGRIR